ncbi:hypothetical protein [Govanella unica]|uniref:Uncharacterized protein n=1 Tax=Govanella unica TaxID=2975056 RepID=A0A9X3TVY4_9PROT|nr:hypothetical protein [Govania unica]MDA5192763.1 hypothetical protein [Govania unica]
MSDTPPDRPSFEALTLARDALRDLWDARRFHVILSLIAVLPRAVMDAFGLLSPYYAGVLAQTLPPGYWQAALLFLLWAALWNTPMLVLWFRRFMVGPQDVLRLGLGQLTQRSLLFLGYSFLLIVGIGVIVMLSTVVLSGILSIFASGKSAAALPFGFLLVLVIGLYFFFGTRFMLTFGALTVGERLSLRDSWRLTANIAGPIIGALALCLLGSLMVAQGIYWLVTLAIIGPSGIPAGAPVPAVLHILDLILAPLNYAATALMAAICARVYHALRHP